MNQKISHADINVALLLLTIMVYPFSIKYSNACTLLCAAHWIVWIIRKPSDITFTKPVILLLILPFIIALISMSYASDFSAASFSIEKKVTLFLLPLILGTIPLINARQFRILLIAACASVALSFVYCLIAAVTSEQSFFENIFWAGFVSPLEMHPTYFSLYINFLIVWVFFDSRDHWRLYPVTKKLLVIVCISTFYLFLFLLSSKVQLVIGIFLFLFLIANSARSRSIRFALAGFMLIGVTVMIVILEESYTIERFRHINKFSYNVDDDIMSFNEVTIRLAIAECSGDILKDHLMFGVGTGNVTDALYKTYEKFKFQPGLKASLNPHNEYLSQLLATGLIGLIVFLGTIVLNIKAAFSRMNIPYIVLIGLFVVNFFFESMLELQRGIMLFSVFIPLFFFHTKEHGERIWGMKI